MQLLNAQNGAAASPAAAAVGKAPAAPAAPQQQRPPSAAVLDGAAMALCAVLAGNRAEQKQAAAEGCVAALAALLERPLDAGGPAARGAAAPQQQQQALTRHLVDAWLELGGATAAVKLLAHARPSVVELACRRVASTVLALAGIAPAAAAATTAARARGGGGDGAKVAAAGTLTQQQQQQPSCSWLSNALPGGGIGAGGARYGGGAGAAAGGGAGGARDGEAAAAALVRAGAPAALLQACRAQAHPPRVLAAACLALRALLAAGGPLVRAALVSLGAHQVLQALQVGATLSAAASGRPLPAANASQAASTAKAAAAAARGGGGNAAVAAARGGSGKARAGAAMGGGVDGAAFGRSSVDSLTAAARAGAAGLPRGGMARAHSAGDVAGPEGAKRAASAQPSALIAQHQQRHHGAGEPRDAAGVTALDVAHLAEQLCSQLLA